MGKFTSFLLLSYSALFGSLCAQAPGDWTRIGDEQATEERGYKITRLGVWRSPDGSQTVSMAVSDPRLAAAPQDIANFWAGMLNRSLVSKVFPLKFESRRQPHLALIFRGQVEREGAESFQDLYLILSRKGPTMIQVAGSKANLAIDFAKWDLGEPIQDEDGKLAEKVEKLTKDMNDNIAKLQALVRKGRQIPEKP